MNCTFYIRRCAHFFSKHWRKRKENMWSLWWIANTYYLSSVGTPRSNYLPHFLTVFTNYLCIQGEIKEKIEIKKKNKWSCSPDAFKCLNNVTVKKKHTARDAVQILTWSRAACILSSAVCQVLVKINYHTAAFTL